MRFGSNHDGNTRETRSQTDSGKVGSFKDFKNQRSCIKLMTLLATT